MKIAGIALGVSLVAVSAVAQPITIHPHPTTDKAVYASPAEWPVDSSQCHWRPGNANAMPMTPVVDDPLMPVFDPKISHTHLDCNLPRFGEVSGPIPITCTIKLFHTKGHISNFWSPVEQIRDLKWRDTGTSTPPVMQGDPMDLRQWVVDMVFDPTMPRPLFPPTFTTPHGWYSGIINVRTNFDNGDFLDTGTVRALYSTMDVTKPETPLSDSGYLNTTRCAPNTLRRPELSAFGNQMGILESGYSQTIPLAPIQAPWATVGSFFSYAALEGNPVPGFQFPNGTFEQRFGVDIHNGVPGTTVFTKTAADSTGLLNQPVTITPAVMGPGKKNLVAFWRQPDGQGNDVTGLYVITVEVGPSVPVPTTCQDPLATNGPKPPSTTGGQLPCVYPVTTVTVPNVVGQTQAGATAALTAAKLALGTVTTANSAMVPVGQVISQVPVSGASAAQGSAVAIVVSLGPVVVPPTWVPFTATFQLLNGRIRVCSTPTTCFELTVKP